LGLAGLDKGLQRGQRGAVANRDKAMGLQGPHRSNEAVDDDMIDLVCRFPLQKAGDGARGALGRVATAAAVAAGGGERARDPASR
jgi:hypothetical protein